MKVLMILDNLFIHDPRPYKEAHSLIENGYEVTVLALDQYREHPKNEVRDGIKIVRCSNTIVSLLNDYNREFLDLIDHFNLFRKLGWWMTGYVEAFKLQKKERFDIIHCHDLFSLPIGMELKKNFDMPLIYDSHEHWEHQMNRRYQSPFSNYYLWIEKQGLDYVDHIITVCKPIQKYFQERGYTDVSIVRNCKEKVTKKYIPPQNDVFTLSYIGGFNEKRFVAKAIEACRDLEDVKFKVAGYSDDNEEIINLINSASNNKIEGLGWIDMDRVIPETLSADATLMWMDSTFRQNRIALPNKLFESMVCGRPIIITENTHSGKLVEKLDMGLTIKDDKESFKSALVKLRDNPDLREKLGKNALKAALLRYNWEMEEKRLLEVYKKVTQ